MFSVYTYFCHFHDEIDQSFSRWLFYISTRKILLKNIFKF